MAKNVFIVHPALTMVARRNGARTNTTDQFLTGRWVARDATDSFAVVGTSKDLANAYGLYLLLEGCVEHIGTNQDFDGTSKKSTNFVTLPSNANQGAMTGAYGVFVAAVGPEGVDPSASIVAQSELTVDQYGRLIVAQSGDIRVAVAEVITSDGNGLTSVIFRTTGN